MASRYSWQLAAICCMAFLASSAAADDEVLPPKQATPVSALRVAEGFRVELVHTAAENEGSWIALAADSRGRLWVSPQDGEPLRRLTIDAAGKLVKNEALPLALSRAMGLLWFRDSLYVSGEGPAGHGLYRVRDTNGDDLLDNAQLLRQFSGRVDGEHGCHALVAGPDGMIYAAQGNHVLPPGDVSPHSPYQHFGEDQLLPSANYGVSGGDKAQMPCGHILRMDADAQHVELFAGGLRNAYDLAFNRAGELFTVDSDTEYSWGLPWHQPVRVVHLVSGGDYGFREGTGKFPYYYEDTLPSAANLGLGSPTGVVFGTRSQFPPPYRDALFAADWTLSRIYALHLTAEGASYRCRPEIVVEGHPLNVTDLEFGTDGALYFTTGGRKTVGALYRITALPGSAEVVAATAPPSDAAQSRRQLEAWHGKAIGDLDSIWQRLGDNDRFIRHAARVGLERQPLAAWRERLQQEQDPRTAISALLALARMGETSDAEPAYQQLSRLPSAKLDRELLLHKLRVIQLAIVRLGPPSALAKEQLLAELGPLFPSADDALNRELAQILIKLDTPNVAGQVVALAQAATDVEQQIALLFYLRHVEQGWSADLRRKYFELFLPQHRAAKHRRETLEWFAYAGLPYADGASFAVYLTNIRDEAARHVPAAERASLEPLLAQPTGEPIPRPVFVPRSFVRAWSTVDFTDDLPSLKTLGKAARGREVFAGAQCWSCHRFENRGAATGPDLSAVARRLSPRDALEAILEPSRVVSDQFRNSIVACTDGRVLVGRIVEDQPARLALAIDATGTLLETVARENIASVTPSPISPMPEGAMNSFTRQEVLDLLAYLLSDPATP